MTGIALASSRVLTIHFKEIMPTRVFQCAACKRILADENCVVEEAEYGKNVVLKCTYMCRSTMQTSRGVSLVMR